jgi:hypothetical protein
MVLFWVVKVDIVDHFKEVRLGRNIQAMFRPTLMEEFKSPVSKCFLASKKATESQHPPDRLFSEWLKTAYLEE